MNLYRNKPNIIGELLKMKRKQKGYSLEQLSAKLALMGITLYGNDLYLIENSKRIVKDFELVALCLLLDIQFDDLKSFIID